VSRPQLRMLFIGAACALGCALSAGSASADTSTISTTWQVQSSANATQTGAQISTPGFGASSWLPETTDDAGGGLTEIGALAQNGDQSPGVPNSSCSLANVFNSHNMLSCWGQGSVGGAPSNTLFAVPWWFRSDFTTPNGFVAGNAAQLVINGVVGQADVWVNGTEVSTQATVTGDYAQYTFDVTSLLNPVGQTNSIALEVYPNNPKTMFTLDTVDWNQPPPDNNTGIQFPIQIHYSKGLAISNAHVVENNASDMSSSALTVKSDVQNVSSGSQNATVTAVVTDPQGNTVANVSQNVTVAANSTQTVVFDPNTYSSLVISHPQLWWPYQMGGQPLYSLSVNVAYTGSSVSDTAPSQTFGIRTVTSYLTPPSNMAPDGVRWFAVNGKPFVWRSGGWSENLFLRYSSSDIASQISVIKSMGLQGIRTEGKEMPDDFYEQFDKAGLIVDGGFQCCDKWQFSASNATQGDYNQMYAAALQIGKSLRNHPSVFNFSWSDNNPTAEQESVTLQGFSKADFQEPIISSAEYKTSPILGPSGEKEGPYDWLPPSYAYDTTTESTDTSFTDVGGSWAFDSEESPGHTVPTLDSLNRFMSSDDLAQLWENPNAQLYHNDPDAASSFGGMTSEDRALTARYGPWTPSATTATGNTTSGGTSVTGVSLTSGSNSNFLTGEQITGAGIQPNTFLTAVTYATTTSTVAANSTTITVASSTNFAVGQPITSTASPDVIAGGTTILNIAGNVWTLSKPTIIAGSASISGGPITMTLSRAATATAAGVTLSGPTPVALSGGEGLGIGQYVEESQAVNYETQRAIFEAYIDHSTNWPTPSTGLDYWMLNKGWPTLLWSLYNNDYDEAGSYFGAKKAQENLHALYAYDNGTVTVDNLTGALQPGLSVESKVYNVGGALLDDQTASNIALPSQGVMNAVLTPNVPATTVPPQPASTYFVELLLKQNGTVVDRNVYWLSTQKDISTPSGSASPTTSQYADMTQLQSLPAATVGVSAASTGGASHVTSVTLTNTGSTVAYLLRVDIRRNCATTPCPATGALSLPNNEVLPVNYSDNDITLFPGESQTIQATYAQSALQGDSPTVTVSGWNLPSSNTAAPSASLSLTAPLADGRPLVQGTATPGQSNTTTEMKKLRGEIVVLNAKPSLRRGTLSLKLSCKGGSEATCAGAIKVTAVMRVKIHRRWHSRSVALGRVSYSMRGSTKRTVRLVLGRTVRARLTGKPKLVLTIVAGR
jgi:Exo-beta-D-glucosaminidase Ig-fold domain/Glycosyl hydrolases family 2